MCWKRGRTNIHSTQNGKVLSNPQEIIPFSSFVAVVVEFLAIFINIVSLFPDLVVLIFHLMEASRPARKGGQGPLAQTVGASIPAHFGQRSTPETSYVFFQHFSLSLPPYLSLYLFLISLFRSLCLHPFAAI